MLDLFAGAGGAACGYSRAGWEHLACVDFDADCVATLCAAGLPGVQARVEDVGAYWHGEPVTFCHASPPCQPFSQAGKGLGEDDARDGFPGLWTALDAVRPTWLAVEQVPALTFQTHRAYFSRVLAEVGARFRWLDWRILDAADFGVPQHRRRLILLAGPRPVRWPRPTHDRPDRCALTGAAPWPVEPASCVTISAFQGLGSRWARDKWERQTGRRYRTITECATLQAFPPDWPFTGTITSRYRQVGNAVCPPVAEAIGRSVLDVAQERAA